MILASAVLLASRRVETERRNVSKSAQEQTVREALRLHGLQETYPIAHVLAHGLQELLAFIDATRPSLRP